MKNVSISVGTLTQVYEVSVTSSERLASVTKGTYLELQNPLIFFASLIMGSALLPMASSKKELALLGGTFIFGLGALEMVLRIGGY